MITATIYPAVTATALGKAMAVVEYRHLIANPDIASIEIDSADKDTRRAAKARLRYWARHRATYRNDASVLGCYGALLDWDEASRDAVSNEVAALGCGVTVFPSPSHWSGSGYYKVRASIDYSRVVTADEHRHLYRYGILPRCPSADQSMFVPSIGCYAPSVSAANRPRWWVYEHAGAPLDVDATLASLAPAPVRAPVLEHTEREPQHPATPAYRLVRFKTDVIGRHVRPASQAKTRDMTSPNKQASLRAIVFPAIEWGLSFDALLDHLVSLGDGWTRAELELGATKVWESSNRVHWESKLSREDFARDLDPDKLSRVLAAVRMIP